MLGDCSILINLSRKPEKCILCLVIISSIEILLLYLPLAAFVVTMCDGLLFSCTPEIKASVFSEDGPTIAVPQKSKKLVSSLKSSFLTVRKSKLLLW